MSHDVMDLSPTQNFETGDDRGKSDLPTPNTHAACLKLLCAPDSADSDFGEPTSIRRIITIGFRIKEDHELGCFLDMELLGSCSMVSRRGLLPKEASRVDACKRVLVLLACARLPFERYMRACRQFAVSKVAYGWIAHAPPLSLCTRLWSCVHVGSRRLRSAAVWLRAALWGGGMHLDILFCYAVDWHFLSFAKETFFVVEQCWWFAVSCVACLACVAWLGLRRPWIWHHDLTGHFLDLSVAGDAGASQHIVRDAWRAWCLQRHNASSRRDAALDCFGDTGYFRSIDWEATRKFAASCPEARTICTGGCNSPAALGGRLAGVPLDMCLARLFSAWDI